MGIAWRSSHGAFVLELQTIGGGRPAIELEAGSK
jgi:hypothetical protein